MKFGDILKNLLEQEGMTQKEFAHILGITPAALGNYIHNAREPDFNILLQIADYFHVSTDYLLNHNVEYTYSHDEDVLLHIFRSLTPEQKEFYIEQGKIFIKQKVVQKHPYSRTITKSTMYISDLHCTFYYLTKFICVLILLICILSKCDVKVIAASYPILFPSL